MYSNDNKYIFFYYKRKKIYWLQCEQILQRTSKQFETEKKFYHFISKSKFLLASRMNSDLLLHPHLVLCNTHGAQNSNGFMVKDLQNFFNLIHNFQIWHGQHMGDRVWVGFGLVRVFLGFRTVQRMVSRALHGRYIGHPSRGTRGNFVGR
jgi:hypothetical protein